MEELKKPVQYIKGVGPKTSLLLNRMNIFTIEDLLNHFPRQYEDRRMVKPINELSDGETASVIGEVSLIDRDRYTNSGKHITRIIFKNDTGFVVGVWFNQKFIKKNFKTGQKYMLYGKISKLYGELQILNPEYERVEDRVTSSIMPVYPTTKNLPQKTLRNILHNVISSQALKIEETLPEKLKHKFNLQSIDSAIRNIHFPGDGEKIRLARKRLKFEELLVLQLGLMMEKHRVYSDYKGIKFDISPELSNFMNSLPFKLTNAQKKALDDILCDMKSDKKMNRLLQGDVGSGKTVVAAIALFNAVKNGYQGILMAPTEILAYQHFNSLSSMFKDYGINVELLSGKLTKKQKEDIKSRAKSGDIDIIVGTHAIIQEDVEFKNPGLVITDEQHRFGVKQRAMLTKKGENPDTIVMTATPIPRTMALFIYGDLDISIIDEMPPGRQKIDTYPVRPSMRQRVYNFVRSEISKGRQAYVVCPLIEDSDVLEVESAVETSRKLQEEFLKDVRVGLLHGKMKPQEKDSIMMDFYNGKIDALVSTTVIEVGINVPNATVMVVENADRFGLSTLHQLRGRVGRSSHKSYCILISDMKSEVSKKRMEIMKKMDDGFKISEEDMKLRGTGEFFGTRQHGLPELKLADIFRDIEILRAANSLAKELISSKSIYSEEFDNLRIKVEDKFNSRHDEITFN